MISLQRLPDPSSLADLKRDHLARLLAPLDDMWETGIIAPAPHWEMRVDGEPAAWFAVTEDGTLVEFVVRAGFEEHGRDLFNHVTATDFVLRAAASTIDPEFLGLCMDAGTAVEVHTLLYELPEDAPLPAADPGSSFRPVAAGELERAVAFQQECIDLGRDLGEWLLDYSGSRIGRGELFVLCRSDAWMGLGECRVSDSQEGVAHVGMMVAPAHRGQGLGTDILGRLCARGRGLGHRVVCSTTVENLGAQRAIERCGFVSRHRILMVSF